MSASSHPLQDIRKLGQSIWLDNVERRMIKAGAFEMLIREDGLAGVTSNPTIFDKAISKSTDYDSDLYRMAEEGQDAETIYWNLVVKDIQDTCDIFDSVYKATAGHDGFVSIEVSPRLAYDTEGTVRQAQELWKRVNRKNVMIKVPATVEGVPAVKELIAEGLNVNVTLIFSIKRYHEVMDAYLDGIERRVEKGLPVSSIASVASFFISRVDTAVDQEVAGHLKHETSAEKIAILKTLAGKAAVANSKMAYRQYEIVFSSERFRHLEAAGARPQRPLWASTSTKNPAYSDVLYVENLIGANTVNTLPPATLDAFRDHGKARLSIREDFEGVKEVFKNLNRVDIDLDNITIALEQEGVKLFEKSYEDLLHHLHEKIAPRPAGR